MSSSVITNKDVFPPQNWVLSPALDVALIIAAPLLATIWATATLAAFGPAVVLAIFAVCNVAHHFPTFIRIYGDQRLLERFRWSLLLGPVIPFVCFMVVVAQGINAGLSVEFVMYMFIILHIWDPWHFLMQHYGFMRIYDRHNAAPRELAARMDLLISWAWFLFIMLATVDWLPDILYGLYIKHNISLLYIFDSGVFPIILMLTFITAIAATVVYAGYVLWCIRKGFYVSYAKLWLVLITFGVMYLTYVPNPLMLRLFPQWHFGLGFATLGMVHVTQYLAIVWKYNRGLASRPGQVRSKVFQAIFARGGVIMMLGYVVICLTYGLLISSSGRMYVAWVVGQFNQYLVLQWITGVILAIGFTSTLTHYYFDGFIWKVRHKENERNLGLNDGPTSNGTSKSWWDGSSQALPILKTLQRQVVYFGLPMAVLATSYWYVSQQPQVVLRHKVHSAFQLAERGEHEQSKRIADSVIKTIDNRLTVETAMIEIRPRAKHYSYAAYLAHTKAKLENELLPELAHAADRDPSESDFAQAYRQDMQQAIEALEQALHAPGDCGHVEEPGLNRETIVERLAEWRDELGQS